MKRRHSFAFFIIGCALLLAYLACGPTLSARAQKHSAVAKKTDAATLELKRGKLLYAKRDYAAALTSFSKAIELRPDWADAYVQRGAVRRVQGELDLAIKDFDKALALDAASMHNDLMAAEAYINHGSIRKNNLQIEAALVAYDKAAMLFPTLTQTYLQRGQARLLADAFDGAIADFDYYIANEKHDPFSRAFAYADRSLVKRMRGKPQEADGDLQESLNLMKGMKGGEQVIQEHLKDMRAQLEVLRKIRSLTPDKVALNR